jgi:hypothetical protein
MLSLPSEVAGFSEPEFRGSENDCTGLACSS